MKKTRLFNKLIKAMLSLTMSFTCLHVTALYATSSSTQPKLADEETIREAMQIVFDEPVSQGTLSGSAGGFGPTEEENRWQQLSLPVGNSYMGANIFGEIGEEHLTFNQKSLWNGGPSNSRPNYDGGNIDTVNGQSMADYVKSVQQAFLDGDPNAASMCSNIIGESSGYGAYQAFGDIYMDFGLDDSQATNYKRNLSLYDAIANVDFTIGQTTYHREYLGNYPSDVLAMKFSATGNDKMNVSLRFPIDNGASDTTLNKTVTTTVTQNQITVAGYMNDNQMKLNGKLKVVLKDGTSSSNGEKLVISDCSEFVVFVNAGTDYKNIYPNYRSGESDAQLNDRVQSKIDAAVEKGYEAIKTEAIEDYQEIFNRVSLNLGQGVSNKTTDQLLSAYNAGTATKEERRQIETTLFQYGRYLQIASSRANDLPANLQGVWSPYVGSASKVPWGSDYHMNVNLQMNYWPTYVTNMAECGQPLIDYVDSLREPGRVTAKTYFGIESNDGEENGFTAHTQNTIFGWTCPGWSFSWGWSPAAVPWILQNCYEYYEYTKDLDYLRTKIYPMLKEEAKFYSQILVEDPETGRMVSAPAYSAEHGPATAGNTYEQSLAWQLFNDAAQAAQVLGVDADLAAKWKEMQEKTMPIEIGTDGQIKEWYHETSLGSVASVGHRHMSHLLGLYPGDLINVDNNEYMDAAIVSLNERGDDATGWGMGQRLNAWARAGDGEHAYRIIKAFFRSGAYPNLWDSHAPFQIDGNFGYTSGVAEMMLQSNMDYLNLLPAMTADWADGSVSGLVGRGNFEVSMDWANTNLTQAQILSKSGGTCTVQYPGIKNAKIVDEQGSEVNVTVINADRISFATTKGDTYTISELPVKAPAVTQAYCGENEALIKFNAVENASGYNIYASTDGKTYNKVSTVTTNEFKGTSHETGMTYKISSIIGGVESSLSKAITLKDLLVKTKLDDRDPLVQYTSGWGNWSDSGQYEGTEKFCESSNEVASFYFYGVGLRVIGMKASNCGTFDLKIDGNVVASNVDTSTNQGSIRQQLLVEKLKLTRGIHKAEIITKTYKTSLDAFEILVGGAPKAIQITNSETTLDLNTATTLQMTSEYLPSGAEGNGINWSVENEIGKPSKIATISSTGLLSANATGKVIVVAGDKQIPELKAKKEITIMRAPTTTEIDDRNTNIHYSSNWSPWDESKHQNGTITESTVLDSSFSYDFNGTGIRLFFMKLERSGSTAGGDIEIKIDNKVVDQVSTFTTVVGSEPKSKVFEKLDIPAGNHTLTVTLKACSGAASGCSPKVSFDYLEVVNGATELGLDYSELVSLVNTYKDKDLQGYKPESVQEFTSAYDAMVNLYDNAQNQQEINTSIDTFKSALKTLEDSKLVDVALAKVENLVAKSNTYSSVVLSWDALADAKAYEIYVSISEKDDFKLKKTTTSTNAIISGLKTQTTYDFYVRAIKDSIVTPDTLVYGEKSDVKNATPDFDKAPILVSVKQKTYGTLQVTWKGMAGASYYVLERREGTSGKWVQLKTFKKDVRTAESRSLKTGTKYYYRIRARRYSGDDKVFSKYSKILSNTPVMKTTTATVTRRSSISARVSWKTVSGASGYEVYRATSSTGKYTKIKTLKADQKSLVSSSLKKGKTYYYKVRAYRNVSGKKVYNKFSKVVSYKAK